MRSKEIKKINSQIHSVSSAGSVDSVGSVVNFAKANEN